MSVGLAARGKWLFWDYPLTRYNLSLQRRTADFKPHPLGLSLVFWLLAGFGSGL